ncbi:MAG: hypothetical protein K2V38_26205, partial [Gemmataceae bacterium]|nr:hypothetical protein [Gemmataceae bacterium]
MTEAEWMACESPEGMLRLLGSGDSERKLLLYSVACCRAGNVPDPYDVAILEATERHVDGSGSEEDIVRAGLCYDSDHIPAHRISSYFELKRVGGAQPPGIRCAAAVSWLARWASTSEE